MCDYYTLLTCKGFAAATEVNVFRSFIWIVFVK